MSGIPELYEIYLRHPIVTTDSRKIVKDCLFFALKGENFNGNAYAKQALENGAAYAIIDETAYQLNEQYILVDDVLTTLQQLATHHRRQFEIPVIGITGSNGKTTTKELLHRVLSSHYIAHCTGGNYNNHIGVPLTLLAMPSDTQVAIIEMGANHVGEIDFLSRIAEPTHGLITNIGKAHLEGFGGIEGVKKGKSELYRFLAERDGVAFVNQDEAFLEELSAPVKRKIFYKRGDTPCSADLPFKIRLVKSEPFIEAVFSCDRGNPVTVRSQLIGHYNFNNIMTAVVLGTYFKVPGEKIKAAVEGYIPSNNRSQVIRSGTNTFVLDAYNANPTSMKNALLAFSKMNAEKKVAILGAMREMGAYSEQEHHAILEQAVSMNPERIILVGREFRNAASTRPEVLYFEQLEEAKNWLAAQQFSNTHFLIKGSRAIKLESLLDVIRQPEKADTE